MMFRFLAAMVIALALSVVPALAVTRVTVNGVPISDIQIAARVKLMQLEGGGDSQRALKSLIDEQLQIQEAKRLGINISSAQIDDAFTSVARNVKLSTDKLRQLLQSRGISMDTMRSRLEAALAWQGVTEIAVKTRVQLSDLQLDEEAQQQLSDGMSYDYILKEVLFVTAGKNAASRTGEANKYRAAFKGCDNAVQLSLSYVDAAVRDLGRRHATQLPEALAKELAGLNVGGITKPRVTENGVSMLAVCSKSSARDTTFIKNKLRNEQGSEAMKAEAAKYLDNLRSKAQIVYN